jgi:UPF0716 protein FxsA
VPLLLLVLFIGLPIAEIYVIVQVGQAIGVLPTIALLLVDGILGTWIFRREGRRAWQALQEAIAAHRIPTREVTDGALVVVGGAFLLAPGFITDVVGLLCVLPPSRAVLRRLLGGVVGRRLLGGSLSPLAGGFPGRRSGSDRDPRRPQSPADPGVIDGEVINGEPTDGQDEGRNDPRLR